MAWPYVLPYRRAFGWGFLLLLATNGVQIAIPWLLKLGVDLLAAGIGASEAGGQLAWIAGGIAIAAGVQAVTRVGSRLFIFGAGRDIEYDVRQQAYSHVLALDSAYYASHSRGDTISRVVNDISNVRLLFGFGVLSFANTLVAYIAALSVMFVLSWKLTLLALAPYPILFVALSKFGANLHRRFLAAQQSLGDLSGFLQEALHGFEVIKGFAQEDSFFERFQSKNQANFAANMRLAWARSLMTPLTIFISGFGIFVVLAGGGYFVIKGEISIGDFVAFQGYLGMLVWPTLALGWLFNVLERGQASLIRVNELLSTQPVVRDSATAQALQLSGQVAIKAETIGVGDSAFALRQLALEVAPGERIALVGKTGSGKTSLLRALQRLIDVPQGTIFYDGVDFCDLQLAALRRQCGYLPQEPFLFGRSLREAMTVGLPTQDHETLALALQQAALADEVAALPRGLDTRLGERGVTLSGGQRQRLMIARLLLTDPKILFFDSPLASLDFATADRVRQTLQAFAAGRTLFWATHRLDNMTWFNRIVLLDAGRIVAVGAHEQMLAQPLYAALFQRQQLLRAIETGAA